MGMAKERGEERREGERRGAKGRREERGPTARTQGTH